MSKVYFLSWKDSPKKPTFSIFSRKNLGLDHELIPFLEGKNEFNEELYFKKITVGKSGLIYKDVEETDPVWQDYPPNEFAWPIISEKLKNILTISNCEDDGIDFIKINVNHFNQSKPYFILRFNKLHDIIDVENTLYVKGTHSIIRPCFIEKAFDKIQIAVKPASHNLWRITSGIYVSEKLRKIMLSEKIEGIEFSKAKSS